MPNGSCAGGEYDHHVRVIGNMLMTDALVFTVFKQPNRLTRATLAIDRDHCSGWHPERTFLQWMVKIVV